MLLQIILRHILQIVCMYYMCDVCMYICVTLENAIILRATHKRTITCSSVTLRNGYIMQGCIEDFFSLAGGQWRLYIC